MRPRPSVATRDGAARVSRIPPCGGFHDTGPPIGSSDDRDKVVSGVGRADRIADRNAMARSDLATHSSRSGEEGAVLLWALMFTIVTAAMIVSHTTFLAAHRREMHVRFEHVTLADNFARSGLSDALAWMQRQPNQPVVSFTPKLDPTGDPPMLETLDPTIGLVREFEVRGSLWGRYEVRRGETFDVSPERGSTAAGTVWDIGSRGFLFVREDAATPFNQKPNRVVATNYLRGEVRGIQLVPPAQAAVVVDDPANVIIGPNATILGGSGPGIAYPGSMSAPVVPTGQVTGASAMVPIVNYGNELSRVFAMHLGQLEAVSDFVVDADAAAATAAAAGSGGNGGAALPGAQEPTAEYAWWNRVLGGPGAAQPRGFAGAGSGVAARSWWATGNANYAAGIGRAPMRAAAPVLQGEAVVLKSNSGAAVLHAGQPLDGQGLVVVDGDLVIESGNVSRLKGVVYVTGDATIGGDFQLQGMLIVKGKLEIGNGTGTAIISYDDGVVQRLKKSLERYRMSRSLRPGWARE